MDDMDEITDVNDYNENDYVSKVTGFNWTKGINLK